jgi:receptor expression-enhancing protein 1/2/3/4
MNILAHVIIVNHLLSCFFRVPMYSEAKLAFIIYLWYPRSKGTTCVYTTFLQPFVSRHELDIDQNLNELRIRAGEMAVVWWQRGFVYAQAHFYELLDYMASQSNRAHPTISPPVHPGNAPQTPCEPTQVPPQVCACLPLFSMLCWQLQNLLQKSNRTSGGRVF